MRTTWIDFFFKWHLVEGPVTYGFTLHLRIRDHTTWIWRCVGTTFGHFLLGSHYFMVKALGSCVKFPLGHGSRESLNSHWLRVSQTSQFKFTWRQFWTITHNILCEISHGQTWLILAHVEGGQWFSLQFCLVAHTKRLSCYLACFD